MVNQDIIESFKKSGPKNGNYTINAKYFADNFEQTITYGNPELFYSIQVSWGHLCEHHRVLLYIF